jgi:hypothetical protein
VSLADAAKELGIAASTLRHQAQEGRIEARVVGKTWITSREAIAGYKRDQLGRIGRPPPRHHFAQVAWPNNMYPGTYTLQLFDASLEPDADRKAVEKGLVLRELLEQLARQAILEGAWTLAELVTKVRIDPRMRDIPVGFADMPSASLYLASPRQVRP